MTSIVPQPLIAQLLPFEEGEVSPEIAEWYRSHRWLTRNPDGSSSLLHPEMIVSEARIFWSQQGEDLEVYIDYFKDRDVADGLYMEMGAGEGLAHSNTKFFEDSEGFRGILVEPSPTAFETLVRFRNSGRNHLIHGAVGEEAGVCQLCVDGRENHRSFVQGDLIAELESTHLPATTDVVEVPRYPLTHIIASAKAPYIDVFFLDVEGSELAVLKGWDWSIPIYVMVIEMFDSATDPKTLQQYEEIREILRNQGYIFNKQHSSNEIWHLPVYRDGRPMLMREWENE